MPTATDTLDLSAFPGRRVSDILLGNSRPHGSHLQVVIQRNADTVVVPLWTAAEAGAYRLTIDKLDASPAQVHEQIRATLALTPRIEATPSGWRARLVATLRTVGYTFLQWSVQLSRKGKVTEYE